jgi:hypothetical protein
MPKILDEWKGVRYLRSAFPKAAKPGYFLHHNHVRHSLDMAHGVNGFRAWWVPDRKFAGFKKCKCGWSGLPHYSLVPDTPCLRKHPWAKMLANAA